jgi:hypothetical protein
MAKSGRRLEASTRVALCCAEPILVGTSVK